MFGGNQGEKKEMLKVEGQYSVRMPTGRMPPLVSLRIASKAT